MRSGTLFAAALGLCLGCGGAPPARPVSSPAPAPGDAPAAATPTRPPHVRRAAVAGSWYPRDPGALARIIDDLLDAAPKAKVAGGPVRALVSPHAGYNYSGAVAARAFKLVQGEARRRVIVIGPAHHVAFSGAAVEDFTHYRTPLGDVPLDLEAVAALRAQGSLGEHDGAGAGEHSIEMVLPFLQRALAPGFLLVPVLVGSIDPAGARALAEALRPFADERTLVVASGDLTHYGESYDYVPFPRSPSLPMQIAALDRGFYERLLDLDPEGLAAYREKTSIDACGYGPFLVLASLLSPDAHSALVRYETSGESTGDWQSSVSYVSASFAGPRAPVDAGEALPRQDMKALLDLAIRALDRGVRAGGAVDPDAVRGSMRLGTRLEQDGASFVTLTERGELRGCIGNLTPREPLFRSVIDNAVAAALHDPRFAPVQPVELAGLEVEVSVLGPLRPVASPSAIRLGVDGVRMEKGLRSAVFLPEVAVKQGWTVPVLLDELAAKGQMARGAWREGARLSVFVTQTLSRRFGR
jgi:hypothetical protein